MCQCQAPQRWGFVPVRIIKFHTPQLDIANSYIVKGRIIIVGSSSYVLGDIFGFASNTVPKSIQLLLRGPTRLEILYALCGEIKNKACQICICL